MPQAAVPAFWAAAFGTAAASVIAYNIATTILINVVLGATTFVDEEGIQWKAL